MDPNQYSKSSNQSHKPTNSNTQSNNTITINQSINIIKATPRTSRKLVTIYKSVKINKPSSILWQLWAKRRRWGVREKLIHLSWIKRFTNTRLLQIKSRFSFESQKKIKEKMEKEGIKMETHQNWIKQSKTNLDWARREAGGGWDRWWGGGALWRMISWEMRKTMISFLASIFNSWRLNEEEEDWDSKKMREK